MNETRAPATTVEGRQNQLVSHAIDLAEKQLLDGTATSQVICHFLKLATVQSQYELEKIKRENVLIEAKTDVIQASKTNSEVYEKAVAAMMSYRGMNE